jgi:hypothetical protein
MEKYMVYGHYRKSDGKLVYIGQSNNPDRWKMTGNSARKGKIYRNGFKKHNGVICKKEYINLTRSEALTLEIILILEYRLNRNKYKNGDGWNMTDGGEGCYGYVHNEKSLNKMKNGLFWLKKDAEKNGLTLISTSYINCNSKYKFKFGCGNEFVKRVDNMKKTTWWCCNECSNRVKGYSRGKKVRNIKSGVIYNSQVHAGKIESLSRSTIADHCKGRIKDKKFEFVE